MSLPWWQTERLARRAARRPDPDRRPLAVVAPVSGGQRLVALDRAALAAGLSPGLMLAAARALVQDLAIAPQDLAGSDADLVALARWATRWTPFAAVWAGSGLDSRLGSGLDSGLGSGLGPGAGGAALMLDVTGCAHLFGGLQALADRIGREIRTLGLTARVAAGPTPGAAFALAVAAAGDGPGLVLAPERLEAVVTRLPVEVLRVAPALTQGLRAVGLKSVGAVARMAPDALARRFGAVLPRQLARTLGREDEAIGPVAEAVDRRARVRLVEPLLTLEGLEIALGRAVAEMCTALEARGEGARRMQVGFWRVDGVVSGVEAGTGRAHADAAQWTRLLAGQLAQAGERMDLGFGVDLVEAAVPVAEQQVAEAVDLDPVAAAAIRSSAAVHRLADRLSARIGAGRVSRLAVLDLWTPELAQSATAALEAAPPAGVQAARAGSSPGAAASHQTALRLRPPLLLDAPEPVEALAEVPDGPPRLVRWRTIALRIARAEGPERLAGAPGGLRDYYRVETDTGRQLWLFRRGLPGDPGAAPQWFVHGAG